ncbi:hypothetical protein AAC387_Pa06g2316 [Persea americana]
MGRYGRLPAFTGMAAEVKRSRAGLVLSVLSFSPLLLAQHCLGVAVLECLQKMAPPASHLMSPCHVKNFFLDKGTFTSLCTA